MLSSWMIVVNINNQFSSTIHVFVLLPIFLLHILQYISEVKLKVLKFGLKELLKDFVISFPSYSETFVYLQFHQEKKLMGDHNYVIISINL